MHEMPVTLSYAVSEEGEPESIVVHMPPMFHPRAGHEHREENFVAAHAHFQGFLAMIEAELRRTPFLWFNFTPMNPPCPVDAPAPSGRTRVLPASRAGSLSSVAR